MKIAIKLVYILLLIMTFSPVITLAAEIIVKVTDENEPVKMAEIILINSKTRHVINAGFTNKSGIYRYSAKHGLYEVIVSKDEFLDVTVKNINIKNSNINKIIKLIPKEFGEEDTASSDGCD